MKHFFVFLFGVIGFFPSAFAQSPILKVGTTYIYETCEAWGPVAPDSQQEEFECPKGSPLLNVTFIKIESTLDHPELTYVFKGAKDDVRIDVAMLDKQMTRVTQVASDREKCKASDLPNADYWRSANFMGKTYMVCGGAADAELQTTSVHLIPVISPLPFHIESAGYWNADATQYYEDANAYREKFYMTPEYLELLGIHSAPGVEYNIQFRLVEIVPSRT